MSTQYHSLKFFTMPDGTSEICRSAHHSALATWVPQQLCRVADPQCGGNLCGVTATSTMSRTLSRSYDNLCRVAGVPQYPRLPLRGRSSWGHEGIECFFSFSFFFNYFFYFLYFYFFIFKLRFLFLINIFYI